jgi:3-deoxy-D-manno-octulosonic-acid transferase
MQSVLDWLPEQLKWGVYLMVCRLLLKSQLDFEIIEPITKDTHKTWIFCSTIGEVNACKPLIDKLAAKSELVFFTDRSTYTESFQKLYPSAHVYSLEHGGNILSLIAQYKPQHLVICEIPGLPNDAPCKLSYELLRRVKKFGAKLHLVNAWLYDYSPSCRQDKLERMFFHRDYLTLFDSITAQNKEVSARLSAAGGKNVIVAGNMKFDALSDTQINIKDPVSEQLLSHYSHSSEPLFIAGCVSGFWEYELVIPAMRWALDNGFSGHFVIAPRHPEKPEHLAKIASLLTDSVLSYNFKSKLKSGVGFTQNVLILDTIGELRSYYSVADSAYIGLNHNVLEPLAFNLPLVVTKGWNTQFPSYPVYYETNQCGLLHEADSIEGVGKFILQHSQHNAANFSAVQQLANMSGATGKCIESMSRVGMVF